LYYPTPIHEQPVFAKLGGYEQLDLPVTLRATREVLSLPVHPLLAEDELECVIEEVNDAC
jgi:dTDP-4-amino-4,6-dideoxygalactose transaminase